jgi:X-Pro dipeptidyl-peptidase
VFIAHGFQDDNVRMNHVSPWWDGLKAHDVPRKLWLMRTGHTDPFEVRRALWVDTLHRWFDNYLHGVDNGIEDGPRVTIEDSKDEWRHYAEWPIPATQDVDVYLRGTSADAPGTLGGSPGGASDSLTFTDTSPSTSENTYLSNPTGGQTTRRVLLSEPLKKPVRLSGTPTVELHASLDKTQSNLGVIIVDYGAGTQVTRAREGVVNTDTRTC